jgi:hypothetical protein
LVQTGRFFRDGPAFPHVGCVYGWLRGSPGELPAHVMLPHVIGNTGGNLPHGQDAGFLGREHDPFVVNADPSDPSFAASSLPLPAHVHAMRAASQGLPILSVEEAAAAETQLASPSIRAAFDLSREPNALREAYGRSPFGQSCLLARRLVERGVRFVTVNMFEKVLGELTWDVHGSAPFGTVESYRAGVGPMFDRAYSTLLADLASRGLLGRTLVVATGEFGRTPTINPSGGRDHWPHVWSMLMAGGGVKGGQVIGASDERGAYPKDRPTRPQEVIASIYHALGVDLNMRLPDPQGDPIPLVEPGAQPIRELF